MPIRIIVVGGLTASETSVSIGQLFDLRIDARASEETGVAIQYSVAQKWALGFVDDDGQVKKQIHRGAHLTQQTEPIRHRVRFGDAPGDMDPHGRIVRITAVIRGGEPPQRIERRTRIGVI